MTGLPVPPILDITKIDELKDHAKRFLNDNGITKIEFDERQVNGNREIAIYYTYPDVTDWQYVGRIHKLY